MSGPTRPPWSGFDPGSAPGLEGAADGPGRVVALLASPSAVSDGWGTEIAIGLARAWSASGRDVVLVDADLEGTSLGRVLGPEGVGLAEVLAGSASIERSVRRVGDGFGFLAAGRTDGPRAALESPHWPRLCSAFVEAGVTLVVHVPAAAPWAGPVRDVANDVIRITGPEEALASEPDPAGRVRAVLGAPHPGPEGGRPEDDGTDEIVGSAAGEIGAVDGGPGEDDDEGLEDPLGLDPFGRGDARGPAAPLETARDRVAGAAAPPVEPEPKLTPSPTGSRRRPLVLGGLGAAAALALLVVLRSGWIGVSSHEPVRAGVEADARRVTETEAGSAREAPGSGAPPASEEAVADEDRSEAPGAASAAGGAEAPAPGAPSFSVALASYADYEAAARHAARLSALVDTLWVAVAPVVLEGRAYHRVLAGHAPDSLGAEALGRALSASGGGASGSWVVRRTGLAFELGSWPERASAEAEAERLRALGIPAYVVAPDGAGEFGFRAYAGAYESPHEAAYLGGLLEALSVEAELTARGSSDPR